MGLFFDYFNSGLRWTLIEKIGPVRVLVQGAASALDEARNALVWLRNQFNPGTTTDIASIEAFAASRGIVRLPEEPYDYYLARLINAFMWYRHGGTEPSLAEVLRLCGYDTIKVTNCRDIDPERWAEFIVDIIPDPDDVLTSEAALLDMISIVKPARSKCAGVRFAVPPSPALIHMGAICTAGIVVAIPPYIPASPVLLSATVGSDGNSLTLVFDRPMTRGPAHVTSDLNIDIENGGTNIPLTYLSGDGSDTHVYKPGTTVRKNEVVDFDYNGRLDGYIDEGGNSLEAVLNLAVINGSEEDFSDIVFWDGFEGTITDNTYEATNYDYPAFHTGVISSGASITPTYKQVGDTCYYASTSAAMSYFPITPFSTIRGRIGAWWKPVSLLTFRGIFGLSIGTSSTLWSIGLRVGGTADQFTINGRTDPVNEWLSVGYTITLPSPIVMNNTYFIELAWDYEAGFFKVFIDGVLVGSIEKASAQSGHFNYIFPGKNPATGTSPVSCAIDNMMLSTDPNRDLYALALLEACPRV